MKENVLENVGTSELATLIFPVLNNDNHIHICGNSSVTVNFQILVKKHPLPTVDELFSKMFGCTVFSKIHVSQGF